MKTTIKVLQILIFLLSLHASGLYAEESARKDTEYFRRKGVNMLAEATAVANTGQGWETYYFAVQPYFQMDTTHLSLYTGMQLTKGTFDFTGGVDVWPWVWNMVKLGFSARYNLNYYDDISMTHNILVGGAAEVRPFRWFGAKASVSGLLKNRSIFAIDNANEYIRNFCHAFSVEADLYLPYDITAYFSVASYERYRYMVAVAPSFTLGVKKQLVNNFYAGLETAVRFTDFFTASTFYDGCEIRLSAGRTF